MSPIRDESSREERSSLNLAAGSVANAESSMEWNIIFSIVSYEKFKTLD